MQKLTRTLLLTAFLCCGGGAYATSVSAVDRSAEQAIADAKEARKHAASVGGEWRDTGKMIKKAEKLLQEGKTEEAAKMAEEAEIQAMLGYIQANSQAGDNLHI